MLNRETYQEKEEGKIWYSLIKMDYSLLKINSCSNSTQYVG